MEGGVAEKKLGGIILAGGRAEGTHCEVHRGRVRGEAGGRHKLEGVEYGRDVANSRLEAGMDEEDVVGRAAGGEGRKSN